MSQKIRFVTASSILFLLMGCTAQEKQVLHELESMPGITCEEDDRSEKLLLKGGRTPPKTWLGVLDAPPRQANAFVRWLRL